MSSYNHRLVTHHLSRVHVLLHELLEALEEVPGSSRVANEIEHRGNLLLFTGWGGGLNERQLVRG